MIITKEIMQAGKSSNNGWNLKQLAALGEPNQSGGWYRRLIGKEVSQEQIDRFLELKDYHLRNRMNKGELIKSNYVNLKKPTFEYTNKVIEYKDQYLHPNWQKMRLYVLNRDRFCCQECGIKDQTLHVHHLKYLKNNYIWAVPTWYLITLCDACHSKEHGRDLRV
jgi:5-methylcytosine-specific restriction protein A